MDDKQPPYNLDDPLSLEELKIIMELRQIDWGRIAVIKKGNRIVTMTSARDTRFDKEEDSR